MAEPGCLHDAHFQYLEVSKELTVGGAFSQHRQVILQSTYTGWNDTALALTKTANGAIILFDKNQETTVTLPAVTTADIGMSFTFVETVASDNARKIVTKYDKDYWVGGVNVGTTGVETAAKGWIPVGSTDRLFTTITFKDNLTDGVGALGSTVTVTAIFAGNTATGGTSKLCWLIQGTMGTADVGGDGTDIFTN